jgi:hypothetical protein
MSSRYRRPTLLEQLPTELFLHIFAFLPLRELVTAFFGLNVYIDAIIRSVRNSKHVVRCHDAHAIKLLQLFPTQIRRLLIVNAETVDFEALITLRSLTLKYGTKKQIDSIRPEHFPMLEILHLKGNELRSS